MFSFLFFFFNDTATTEIYTLSLHDALPIFRPTLQLRLEHPWSRPCRSGLSQDGRLLGGRRSHHSQIEHPALTQIRHRLAILNAAKTTQGEGDATSCFEYLVRGLPDVDPLRLLQDHLGVQHQGSETVTDLVKRGERD